MSNIGIIITGTKGCLIEIHLIDFNKEEYINRFPIINSPKKAAEKLNQLFESYDIKKTIIDFKGLDKDTIAIIASNLKCI